jgi:hypothetical protein
MGADIVYGIISLADSEKGEEKAQSCAIAFHEKAGRSQVDSFWCCIAQGFSAESFACRHPSIRTLSERFVRSVPVGRSRFSRCCHLIIDLRFDF